jgi:hypothetical protein
MKWSIILAVSKLISNHVEHEIPFWFYALALCKWFSRAKCFVFWGQAATVLFAVMKQQMDFVPVGYRFSRLEVHPAQTGIDHTAHPRETITLKLQPNPARSALK